MHDSITTEPLVRPRAVPREKTRRPPPYHVIIENDDFHTFDFVIAVLRKVFAVTEECAAKFALEAHKSGRCIVWTGSREVAELKLEQIHTFAEVAVSGAKLGPLGAIIEPAA